MEELAPDTVRHEQIVELREEPLDVLVIGGGIVGAGVARDAAMRGLRTGLVEKHDLAFGTSSRSSRLLHGGLRYLAQGRVGLVYEASHEKMVLRRIAPHLAAPLPFLFPAYRGTPWPRWKLAVGVKLYDLLCGRRNLGRSQSLSPAAVRKLLPGIRETNLLGAVRYFDGLTNDARLVLDTLRFGRPARRNRAELHGIPGCRCRWPDVGLPRPRYAERQQNIDISARSVVNAAGPWAAAIPHSSLRLRLTKGVHLVIDAARLPLPSAVVITAGARILFGIPWGERVILGTTDTDYSGPPEAIAADMQDVEYILEIINESFPAAGLRPIDVISHWAGLRPLIDTGRGGPLRYLAGPSDPHAPAGLVRRGRWQAYYLSADCPAGGRSSRRLSRSQGGTLPHGGRAPALARQPGGLQRHSAAAHPPKGRRAQLPPRVGPSFGRCDDPPHELALLLCRRGKDCCRGRRLDGRCARLGRGPAGGGSPAVYIHLPHCDRAGKIDSWPTNTNVAAGP